MKISKGAEIPTKDGIVVVPEDTNIYSAGAYEEQLQRAIKSR